MLVREKALFFCSAGVHIPVKSAKPEIVAIEAPHREPVSVKSPELEVIETLAPSANEPA
jgi:hypothetical protein